MKFFIVCFPLFWFLTSCSLSDGKDYSYNDVMNVIYEYNKKISKEKSVELDSYGLYYAGADKIYDGKIHIIDLGYSVDQRMQYEEARKWFYELVDGLLENINNTEYLRRYFYRYPVGYEDLIFRLSFYSDDKNFLKKGDVLQVNIFNNKVSFHVLEEDGALEEKHRPVSSEVFILEGFFPKTRNITEDPPVKS